PPHHPPDRPLSGRGGAASGSVPGRGPPPRSPGRGRRVLRGRAAPGVRPQALHPHQLPGPAGGAGGHPPPRPTPGSPLPPPLGPARSGDAAGLGAGPAPARRAARLPGRAHCPLRDHRGPPSPAAQGEVVRPVVPITTAALAAAPPDTAERVSHVYEQHLEAAP